MVTLAKAIKAKNYLVQVIGHPFPEWLSSIGVCRPEEEGGDYSIMIGVSELNYYAELLARTNYDNVQIRVRIQNPDQFF